jgi:hypothetical protein
MKTKTEKIPNRNKIAFQDFEEPLDLSRVTNHELAWPASRTQVTNCGVESRHDVHEAAARGGSARGDHV